MCYNSVNADVVIKQIDKQRKLRRFALSAIRRELLERERERDSFGILYTGYLLFIVKIKREIKRKIKRERKERERVSVTKSVT